MTRRLLLLLALMVSASLIVAACGSSSSSATPGATTAATSSANASASASTSASSPSATASGVASGSPSSSPSTGTGGSSSPSAGNSGGSPAAAQCADAGANQTINMWSPLTGGDGGVLTELAQQFNQENGKGITVNHVPQPDYMLSLNNAAGSPSELPEMTVARVINVAELAGRHIIQPYSDQMMSAIGLGDSDFPANLWTRGTYQGQRYSIPWDEQVLVMYYNKDMFTAAGVAEPPAGQPWSNTDFNAALDKLKANGQPIVVGNGFQAGVLFQTLIVQLGGSLANADGTQAVYNSPQGLQALKDVVALRDKGLPGVSGTGDPEVQAFKQKQAAIVFHGPWHISDMKQVTDFQVGYAPVPQLDGSNYAVWAGSHQFALITQDPAKQAAVACWIRWASDHSVKWATAGNFPARTSQREDPSLPTIAPEIARVAGVVDKGIILPTQPGLEGALWGSGFGPVVDKALAGDLKEADYQKALDDAVAASNQLIAQNMAGASGSPGASASASASPSY